MNNNIVLIAGHNPRSYGKEIEDTKEYYFSKMIIDTVCESVKNKIDYEIITFQLNSLKNKIKKVNEINPLLAIELHWNSFYNNNVKGSEVFYQEDNDFSKLSAEKYCNIYEKVSGIKSRGIKLDIESQHTRLGWIRDIKSPSILIENEFLSWTGFDRKLYYHISVTAMIRFFNEIINLEIK